MSAASTHSQYRDDGLAAKVKAMPLKPLVAQYIRLQNAGGDRFKALCPFHGEKTASFYINEKKGSFNCFGCGAHGSVIDFVMMIENLTFKDALRDAAAFYGLGAENSPGRPRQKIAPVQRETPEEENARVAREVETAREIFRSGMPAAGTLVEGYLREARKIPLEKLPAGLPPTIRFAPAVEYWHEVAGRRQMIGKFPAMVTAIQGNDGKIMGAHITYLDPVTADKINRPDPNKPGAVLPKKKIRGLAFGCGIRLAPASEDMQVAEGIENALTAMALHPQKIPAWTAISLQNLAGRGIGQGEPHPRFLDKKLPSVYPDIDAPSFRFLPVTKKVAIIKDSDSKDWESAERLFERAARKFKQQGVREIFMVSPPRGYDLNDVLREGRP